MRKKNSNDIVRVLLITSITLAVLSLVWVYIPEKFGNQTLLASPAKSKQNRMLPPLKKEPEKKETIRLVPSNIQKAQQSVAIIHKPKESKINKTAEPQWVLPPSELQDEYDFWLKIYTKYDSKTAVMHDQQNLNIIYGIVDLRDIDDNNWLTDFQKETARQNRIDAAKEQIGQKLMHLSQNPPTEELDEEERRIRFLFTKVSEPQKFIMATQGKRIRAQIGQCDKFNGAVEISGQYMPEIERIFQSHNLPIELTRLIFVESMFNTQARSSVGAAGIWQFMRSTGKLYLKINSYVDERLDPYLATHAAAKFLAKNYDLLGSWPLAINAYNTGAGRMTDAVSKLGTTNIVKIIKNYDHPSYGFASSNFFVEFLAAYEAFKNKQTYFPNAVSQTPLTFDEVTLTYNISIPEVASLAQIDIAEIRKLNPSFTDAVLLGNLHLPSGFKLKTPPGKGELVNALSSRAPKSYIGPVKHKVSSDDDLNDLSEFFGVTVDQIKQLNDLENNDLIAGQEIRIPMIAKSP